MTISLQKLLALCLLTCICSLSFASPKIKVAFINPAPKGNNFWDIAVSFMQASADDLEIDLNIIYTPTFHRSESYKISRPQATEFLEQSKLLTI